MGLDFIELAGNRYEKIKKEVAQNLRSNLKKSQIYLTGGFCKVETMVLAIQNQDADGIGLSRSVTAEPGKSVTCIL